MVQVSISTGASDLTHVRRRMVPLVEILDLSSRDKMLQIPVDDVDDETCRVVRSWPGRLHAYGMEISTGPVVPFRAVSFLDHDGQSPESHVLLIEVVTSHGPMTPKRVIELQAMHVSCTIPAVYLSAFPDFTEFRKHLKEIAWETEVWIAEIPDHMIHFNGDHFMDHP